MKIIQELTDMIEDEIDGAHEYAQSALTMREDHPTLAKTFYDISLDEVKHINMLHDEVRKIIEKHRKEKGDPPAAMLTVYEYLHKKHIAKAAEIKSLQAQYKESAYS